VAEGESTIVTISLSRPQAAALTVHYAVGGTATFGQDYTLSGMPGVVVIPAGKLSANVTVTAMADKAKREQQETVILTLVDGTQFRDFVKVFIDSQRGNGRGRGHRGKG